MVTNVSARNIRAAGSSGMSVTMCQTTPDVSKDHNTSIFRIMKWKYSWTMML
jgi:hypothetical protein